MDRTTAPSRTNGLLRGLAKITLWFAPVMLPTTSFSQGRVSMETMTCRAAEGLVTSRGAVVLGTGPYTYDRFVRDGSYCDIRQTTRPAYERTADSAQCFIGYQCRARDGGGNGGGP